MLVVLTFILIARGFGKDAFGLVAAMLGICAVLQDVGDMGTSQWLSRELAGHRITSNKARSLLCNRGLLVAVSSALLGAGAVLGGVALVSVAAVWTYLVGAVVNAGMHARLRAEGGFHRSAGHLVGERLLWIGVVFLMVGMGAHGQMAAGSVVASMGLSYLASAVLAPQWAVSGATVQLREVGLGGMYRSAAHFGVMGLASDLQKLDVTLAAGLGSVSAAADVGVASKLTSPAVLIASNISQVLFRDVAAASPEVLKSVQAARRLSMLLAMSLFLLAPFAPAVAVLLLGDQFANAGPTIVIYMLGTALAVLNQPIAGMLNAQGFEKSVTRFVVAGALTGLSFGGAFVHEFGSISFGVGFVLTQGIVLVGCWRIRSWTPFEMYRW